MKVSLTKHAKDRIYQRVGITVNADIIDTTNLFYAKKYKNKTTNNPMTLYVIPVRKQDPIVLAVDTLLKTVTTVMTEGPTVVEAVRKYNSYTTSKARAMA
jgi:hypothetical protein